LLTGWSPNALEYTVALFVGFRSASVASPSFSLLHLALKNVSCGSYPWTIDLIISSNLGILP
jgi:hypothetical protein